ncbi:MAG: MFS transporter [Enterocloster aldenensis]
MAAVGSGLVQSQHHHGGPVVSGQKGFASGLITGATSLVVAPVANMLLERYNVSVAFRIVGAAFLLLMFCASLLTDTPEPGWVPGGCEAGGKASNAGAANDLTWKEMFGDRRFYLIWLAFLGGCVSGLMLIGHASTIGKEVAGISSGEAALLVGIMAVANFLGRMLMGGLSDKIGRYQTILISLAASTVGMVVLSRAKGFFIFVTALILLCVCFGGVLSVFPNIVSENFGLKNMGINYGIVFTAYGIAALIGPMTASAVKDASGSYNMAFIIAGVFAAAAFILVYVIYCMSKKNKEIPGMD